MQYYESINYDEQLFTVLADKTFKYHFNIVIKLDEKLYDKIILENKFGKDFYRILINDRFRILIEEMEKKKKGTYHCIKYNDNKLPYIEAVLNSKDVTNTN